MIASFDYENTKMLLCHSNLYPGNYLTQYAKNTGDTKKPGFGGEFLKRFKPNNFFKKINASFSVLLLSQFLL